MKRVGLVSFLAVLSAVLYGQSLTPIPNNDFEQWTNYGDYWDPDSWDTPNEEISAIPFFGTTVVTRSTEHQSGNYSARLESKDVFLVGQVPGFMTCGKLTIDLATLSFEITGGAPVYDMPTHLKGYYRFFPKGGDSCAIGIGLFKTIDSIPMEIGIGQFSTKDTVADWTLFSAWIDYDSLLQPDTMNIIALSSAQEVMTAGTVLFVDDLFLDYTVGIHSEDPGSGIHIYQDHETRRLLVFFGFNRVEQTRINLYSMTGQSMVVLSEEGIMKGRRIIPYGDLIQGIYILEVIHNGKRFVTKYFLTP
ncbi:MAG: T9SS type A sorting domain-containing protein [bacterium]